MFTTNGYWTCPNHAYFESIDISSVKQHETYWGCKCIFHMIEHAQDCRCMYCNDTGN